MTNVSGSKSARAVSWMRRIATYAAVLLVGFLLGWVPMWFQSRESDNSLSEAATRAGVVQAQGALASEAAARQLGLATMQNMLASAAIDAQRGDYESARQAASGFFTALRDEANKGADSSLSQAQKDGAEPVFAGRDELIALLARSDPAATERLSALYVSFRELMTK
ncbi:MAG: hypothetical protein GX597_25620 [Anaerolineaceae bacterium]|nr:hypothetical protein [Anaerolineaceae bacterium]